MVPQYQRQTLTLINDEEEELQMPIPLGYSRNVIEGTLRNGEIFQWGFWVSEAPSTADAANTQAGAIRDALSTDLAAAGSPLHFIDPNSYYTKVRVYSYPNGGPQATYIGEAGMAGQQGTGPGDLPNQVALVFTLSTGLAGRRHRGRVYLPANAIPMTAGQLAAGDPATYATWMKNFLDHVNAAVSPGFAVVLSQVAGSAQRITSVTVDSRLDIQRRRADREKAQFSSTQAL